MILDAVCRFCDRTTEYIEGEEQPGDRCGCRSRMPVALVRAGRRPWWRRWFFWLDRVITARCSMCYADLDDGRCRNCDDAAILNRPVARNIPLPSPPISRYRP